MQGRQILVVDVETTGCDPRHDAIVEIGACLLSPDTLAELEQFSSRVRPSASIQPGALLVHGLTEDILAEEPGIRPVMESFLSFAPADAILAGHNVAFDISFIRAALESQGIEYPFDYHSIDIWSVAYVDLLRRGMLPGALTLDTLGQLYGVARSGYHSAIEDARISTRILRELLAGASTKCSMAQ